MKRKQPRNSKYSNRANGSRVFTPNPKRQGGPDIVGFGAIIRDLRTEAGISQDQLAERAELTPNYIGTIENGYRDPSLSTLQQLAKGLGVPIARLFGPSKELSPDALEMAKLFQDALEGVQRGVLILLRGIAKRQRLQARLQEPPSMPTP